MASGGDSPLGVLFAGSVSGILADVATHPLSTLKTRLQCTGAELSKHHPKLSFYTGFRNILRQEGVGALYRGVGIVCAVAAPGQALYFVGYEAARAVGDKSPIANFIAGGCAQLTGSLVWVPMDVIKERLQIEGKIQTNESYGGSYNATKQIFRNEGMIGLYRAFWIHQATWVPFNGIYFSVYEFAKKEMKLRFNNSSSSSRIDGRNIKDELMLNVPCSLFASAIASVATSPLDLIKTRLQVQQSNPTIFDYKGPIDAAVKIVKREGTKALFDGLAARIIWLTPRLSLAVTLYEQIKSLPMTKYL